MIARFIINMSEPFHKEPRFREDSGIYYPPFCTTYFEKYFYNYMMRGYHNGTIDKAIYDRYIPVFWTEVQISKRYDDTLLTKVKTEDNDFLWTLWDLLRDLPPNKTYFTVVQHDDGIVFSSKSTNLITFGMGGIGNIPIPLTYDENLSFDTYKNSEKTVFCSFVGSLTHPCRKQMVEAFSSRAEVADRISWSNRAEVADRSTMTNKPDIFIVVDDWTNQIQEEKQTLYLQVMGKSRFTLAPRGYGKTSFRLYEALRMGSIPVYIYDDPWLPYQDILDWSKMAVLVHVDELDGLYERLLNIGDDEVAAYLAYYNNHSHLFSYDGICEYILNSFTK